MDQRPVVHSLTERSVGQDADVGAIESLQSRVEGYHARQGRVGDHRDWSGLSDGRKTRVVLPRVTASEAGGYRVAAEGVGGAAARSSHSGSGASRGGAVFEGLCDSQSGDRQAEVDRGFEEPKQGVCGPVSEVGDSGVSGGCFGSTWVVDGDAGHSPRVSRAVVSRQVASVAGLQHTGSSLPQQECMLRLGSSSMVLDIGDACNSVLPAGRLPLDCHGLYGRHLVSGQVGRGGSGGTNDGSGVTGGAGSEAVEERPMGTSPIGHVLGVSGISLRRRANVLCVREIEEDGDRDGNGSSETNSARSQAASSCEDTGEAGRKNHVSVLGDEAGQTENKGSLRLHCVEEVLAVVGCGLTSGGRGSRMVGTVIARRRGGVVEDQHGEVLKTGSGNSVVGRQLESVRGCVGLPSAGGKEQSEGSGFSGSGLGGSECDSRRVRGRGFSSPHRVQGVGGYSSGSGSVWSPSGWKASGTLLRQSRRGQDRQQWVQSFEATRSVSSEAVASLHSEEDHTGSRVGTDGSEHLRCSISYEGGSRLASGPRCVSGSAEEVGLFRHRSLCFGTVPPDSEIRHSASAEGSVQRGRLHSGLGRVPAVLDKPSVVTHSTGTGTFGRVRGLEVSRRSRSDAHVAQSVVVPAISGDVSGQRDTGLERRMLLEDGSGIGCKDSSGTKPFEAMEVGGTQGSPIRKIPARSEAGGDMRGGSLSGANTGVTGWLGHTKLPSWSLWARVQESLARRGRELRPMSQSSELELHGRVEELLGGHALSDSTRRSYLSRVERLAKAGFVPPLSVRDLCNLVAFADMEAVVPGTLHGWLAALKRVHLEAGMPCFFEEYLVKQCVLAFEKKYSAERASGARASTKARARPIQPVILEWWLDHFGSEQGFAQLVADKERLAAVAVILTTYFLALRPDTAVRLCPRDCVFSQSHVEVLVPREKTGHMDTDPRPCLIRGSADSRSTWLKVLRAAVDQCSPSSYGFPIFRPVSVLKEELEAGGTLQLGSGSNVRCELRLQVVDRLKSLLSEHLRELCKWSVDCLSLVEGYSDAEVQLALPSNVGFRDEVAADSLRPSHASAAVRLGYSVESIQAIVRWSSSDMVDLYTRAGLAEPGPLLAAEFALVYARVGDSRSHSV